MKDLKSGTTLRAMFAAALFILFLSCFASAQRKTTAADCRKKADPETIFLDLSENTTQAFVTKFMTCGKWELQAIDSGDPARPVAWSPYGVEECGKDSCNCVRGYTASFHVFYTHYPDTGNGVQLFQTTPRSCKDPKDIIKKAKPRVFTLTKNAMVTFWLTTAHLRRPYDIRGGGLTISIKKIL